MIGKAIWPAALVLFGACVVLVVLWGDRRESRGFERGFLQAEMEMARAAEATRERVRNADTSSGDACDDERFIRDALGRVPTGGAAGAPCP